MNLHIVPDNVFINKFFENLQEVGVQDNNRFVVRTNLGKLKFIKQDLPFARLYSSGFRQLCGKTGNYDKVFIHQFTPLLYRWVATQEFRELDWMVWGADLYNLPTVRTNLYEELTLSRYVKKNFSLQEFLYEVKVSLLNKPYQKTAYSKVKNVLTWMEMEYAFALRHLPGLQANHQFFFYENQLPYQALDTVIENSPVAGNRLVPTYILGNSSTAELNHLDAVAWMHREGVRANLQVPVSYGDRRYTDFLKRSLSFYQGGSIEFVDRYMTINEYLRFLYNADGLIMNNVRPQGYGNIFMMMYLGKKVFLNEKNLSGEELKKKGLIWFPLSQLKENSDMDLQKNRSSVLRLLSHETLLKVYRELFS